MKKLLYIGHPYHNKTKSSQFIQKLLETQYEITKFDFDAHNDSLDKFKELMETKFDNVVLWQTMPEISKLKKYVKCQKITFFPMYDDIGDFNGKLWQEYSCCNIINFSKTLHKQCQKRGFSSHYIQYFPEPIEITNWGDKNSVFLWQRIDSINSSIVENLLDTNKMNKFYLHKALDPKYEFVEPSKSLADKTELSTWFDTQADLLNHMQKSAIYFAPREYEGIGMSFLEAMAMGRCVIAPNNPTMNEYITNGENGYLYEINNLQKINIENIEKIQNNSVEYIKNGHKNWEENKNKILEWITISAKPNKLKIWKFYTLKRFLQNLFSIKNENKNGQKTKILRILGIKLNIK